MSEKASGKTGKSIDDLKAQAKKKAGESKKFDINTAKFQKNSDSFRVFNVLEKARAPITLEVLKERATKLGLKNPDRAKTVANWFVTQGVVSREDGKYLLVVRPDPKPAKTETKTAPKGEVKAEAQAAAQAA